MFAYFAGGYTFATIYKEKTFKKVKDRPTDQQGTASHREFKDEKKHTNVS